MMHLDGVSQELFYEALHTVPGKALKAEVKFVAAGIPEVGEFEGSETESYLVQCSNAGVMPFTALDLYYHSRKGFFAPVWDSYGNSMMGIQPYFADGKLSKARYQIPPSARQSGTIDQYLFGGKFHEITVHISDRLKGDHTAAAYDLFRERVLKAFQTSGYHIFRGEVATGNKKENCHLEVGKWYEHDISLSIHERTSDDVRKPAEDWFHGLQEKYASK